MKSSIRDKPVLDMNNELWRQALEELRLQMSKATFQTWLAQSHVIESTSLPAGLTVAVCNNYTVSYNSNKLGQDKNESIRKI